MSDARLLIDIEVLEFLRTLRSKDQIALLKRFREIAANPSQFSDYPEHDSVGRRVKILDLHHAD